MSFSRPTFEAMDPVVPSSAVAPPRRLVLLLALPLVLLHPRPVRPLLVQRSACAPGQWADLVGRYRALRLQHLLGQHTFQPVIVFSVFGERRHGGPPPTRELAQAAAVGTIPIAVAADLRRRYPDGLMLRCGNP